MDPFVPHGRLTRAPLAPGPLSGLSVAVKDLFDWAGVPTGAGNPDWLATHPVPTADAEVLTTLLAAGASLVGKTITDELAYSIHGDNVHYGTPDNPAAPGRVPGGSSSGSASAVALGLAHAALGTDTGGSVRVPAAYCGLWGLRTTHGLVTRAGLVALSPSFDTVGWFAPSAEVLVRLTDVLVSTDASPTWDQVWSLEGADEATDNDTRAAVEGVRSRLLGSFGPGRALRRFDPAPFGGLEGLRRAYATIQGWEAWALHGPWIEEHHPRLGPAIAGRFEVASRITPDQAAGARATLQALRAALRGALGDRGVLVLPSTAGPAPLVGEDPATVDAVRTQTMRLTCPAGLAGLPQVNLPFRGADGLPRGVGLVGPAGTDGALCRLAQAVGVP